MTANLSVKCHSCGVEFSMPFEPLPIQNYPRKDLLERFVCGECGSKTEQGKKFRMEWNAYLDKYR
jgi:hypothetical protein